MGKRVNFFSIAPKAMKIMLDIEKYIKEDTTIEPILFELIKMRVSQINGCAYCLNMHTIDAVKLGESPRRIYLLNAWRETKLFTDKEKMALELTEQLTFVSTVEVDEDLYEQVLEYFTEKEFADLVVIINQINAWNRINISTHNDVDLDYK